MFFSFRTSWWTWKRRVKNLAWNSTFKKLRSWYLAPCLHGKYKGKKVEAVTEFIFLGSKITADDDHSYEIKRCLLNKMEQKYLGKKYMTNIDSVLKSRNNILPKKIHIVKAMFFPAVIYECESRTIKKAECWGIDTFKLWCWRRLLRVPWIAGRSNQSILKEINLEYSLKGLMLKLKLQYFGHLIWRDNSPEKTLMLGKIEGKREGSGIGWEG